MADIFISYSSTDKTMVKCLAALLEAKGWSVWWDRQIPVGQKYDNVIETELNNARCVLVVWTTRSIASEWVKNEASEAAQKGKLIPVMIEEVNLPLAFKRIECAMLPGWTGDADHPELEILFDSVTAMLARELDRGGHTPRPPDPKPFYNNTGNYLIAAAGLAGIASILFLYSRQKHLWSDGLFFGMLFLFGIAIAGFVFGLVKIYCNAGRLPFTTTLKLAGPALGLLLILTGAILVPRNPAEKNISIRLFDWKKNPISQGDVKIYLPEYVRTQSIDKMGQALFTGIPAGNFNRKIKIEVSSPGYAGKTFDTLLLSTQLELTLPLTTVVFISGKVKTAAEVPISGVEVNVDGTRYYALSITDGSYNLRLEEYTLGDEINLTTSHKDYEDKTTSLIITSPSIKNQDIFLNPIAH